MNASYPGYPLTGPLKAPAPAPAPAPSLMNHHASEVPRQDSRSNKHITPDREKGTGGNKRQKMDNSRTSMSYPRKRAVTACQLCRTRKTKCNNARPRCKLCLDLGTECLYEDRSDHSSFDPASLMMLERLNTIIERLDTITPASAPPINTPRSAGQTPAGFLQSNNGDLDDDQDGEYMRIHSSEMSPDRVLQWPIFEGRYEPECLAKALFETQGGSENLEDPLHGRMFSDLEERIPPLIETFLGYVHIKNPILDPHTLKSYARHVSQEGFGWDAISCLVLIACALGALAEPFDSTLHIYAQPSPIHEKDSLEISRDSLFIASKYFTMSRKRIGLLDATIIRCQCYLLSGVYLMYTLRPLEAWQNFLQASTSYHVYLKGQSRLNKISESPISPTRLLEQRLFFSCFKSECEIRVELSLPESGLFSIKYPDMFPSPPVESFEAEDVLPISLSDRTTNAHQEANNTIKGRAPSFKQNLKQSWYYYYTEISLRRLGNSILKEFYKSDQPCSGLSIPEMLTMAAGFDEQFSQLYAKVPPIIAYDQNGSGKVPDEELPYFLRARQLDCMLWFMRPFLYHALHNPYDDLYRPLIQNYVDRCLSLSASMIKSMAIRHRHHGTWLSIRHGTSCALSLLAAAKCGHIAMPTDWKTAIYTHVETYKFWEKEVT